MDISQVNSVLEQAIVRFQSEEIEALWEKYKVPTPMQMHKRHGMAMGVTDREVLEPLKQALSPLTAGPGKLTDPNRTPDRAAVRAALDQIEDAAPNMLPKYRKNVLESLKYWLKIARQHAKRIEQAAYKHKVRDVNQGHVIPARVIRDLLNNTRAAIAPMRGGGPGGKAPSKAKPGTGKKRPPKKRPSSGIPSMLDLLSRSPEEIRQELAQKAAAMRGGRTLPDGTVETFIRVLEANVYGPDSLFSRSDAKKRIQTLRSRMKTSLGSDDKRDLKDLIGIVKKLFSAKVGSTSMLPDDVEEWIKQVEAFVRSGRFPKVPAGTMVVPRRDKRQMGLKFEALQRLRLDLAG